jgi:hypothetical protein
LVGGLNCKTQDDVRTGFCRTIWYYTVQLTSPIQCVHHLTCTPCAHCTHSFYRKPATLLPGTWWPILGVRVCEGFVICNPDPYPSVPYP